jgi:hypothetical protein
MELIEHNARITLVVRQIGKPFAMQPDELEALLQLRRRISGTEPSPG